MKPKQLFHKVVHSLNHTQYLRSCFHFYSVQHFAQAQRLKRTLLTLHTVF